MDTRNDIALAISAATGMDAAELLSYIEIPPDSSMGDYAFPCWLRPCARPPRQYLRS